MAQFWRSYRRWDALRVAASALGLTFLLLVAAYVFAAIKAGTTLDASGAVVVALAITGTGLLYAFRLGAGGIVD